MNLQEYRNLQEAYLDVYDEGYKLFPYRKVETKQKQIATDYDSLGKKPLTGKSESEISDTLNNLKRLSNRKSTLGFRSRMHHPDDVRAKENKNKRKYQLSPGETAAQRARRDPEFRRQMIRDRMKTMESYDLYDVILEYLLDEGYADTQEAALAIMGNMSEDWMGSICEDVTYLEVAMGEGKVPWNDPNRPLQSGHTPAEKNRAKRARTGVEDPNKSQMDIPDEDMVRYGGMKTADDTETSKAPKQKKTLFGKPKPLEHETPPHDFKKDRRLDPTRTDNEYGMNQHSSRGGNATRGQARRAVGANFAGYRDGDSSIFPTPIKQGDTRRRTSKKWGGPNPRKPKPEAPRRKTTINASYEPDLYDVILEYLLDEGYADTQESALAIMGNMSEDWRESIAENVTSGKSRVRNVQPKPTGPISNSERQSITQSRIDAENIRIKEAGDAAHATATSKGLGFSDAQARRTAAELRLKREIAKSYP